ncbi:MAG TPA: alpha/beta fold hydrolase [Longimicrobiales bacterium]|nr:alpha/beta fold hydrolase [Longimicrobiales bacterium]
MGGREWVDRDLYPFESRYLDVGPGRMHYVDEGSGPVVLMVHGTPTWSFLYRELIRDLARDHRVIAPDHLGFGLSDHPDEFGYRPEDHARVLEQFIERLGLRDITLVVHDFGGPIGLSYAERHPENVRALVLFNTWLWSLAGSSAERVARVMGSGFGRFLYTRLNISPRMIVPAAFGDRRRLSKAVHRHYIDALDTPRARYPSWVFAREVLGSGEWYEQLWKDRGTLEQHPALLIWGRKDPAFGGALSRWKEAFPAARVVELPDVGHFVQEEAPREATSAIREFLASLTF